MWRIWAAALFWGFNWPVIKILLATVPPWSLRATGLGGGALMLAAFALISRRSLHIPHGQRRHVMVAGLLNVAAFNIFAVFAQLSMPTSRAAILTFTMPLWAALFGWLLLGETIDKRRAAALALGAAGIVILSLPFVEVMRQGGIPFGLLYVLGAAIGWAAGTIYLKHCPIDADPIALTLWQVVVAVVVCTAGMLAFESPSLDLATPRATAAFLYHVALPQSTAYLLWFSLIRQVPPTTAAIGTLLIPIFGVLGSIILLEDWPGATDWIGLLIILSAVALDQFRTRPLPR